MHVVQQTLMSWLLYASDFQAMTVADHKFSNLDCKWSVGKDKAILGYTRLYSELMIT